MREHPMIVALRWGKYGLMLLLGCTTFYVLSYAPYIRWRDGSWDPSDFAGLVQIDFDDDAFSGHLWYMPIESCLDEHWLPLTILKPWNSLWGVDFTCYKQSRIRGINTRFLRYRAMHPVDAEREERPTAISESADAADPVR